MIDKVREDYGHFVTGKQIIFNILVGEDIELCAVIVGIFIRNTAEACDGSHEFTGGDSCIGLPGFGGHTVKKSACIHEVDLGLVFVVSYVRISIGVLAEENLTGSFNLEGELTVYHSTQRNQLTADNRNDVVRIGIDLDLGINESLGGNNIVSALGNGNDSFSVFDLDCGNKGEVLTAYLIQISGVLIPGSKAAEFCFYFMIGIYVDLNREQIGISDLSALELGQFVILVCKGVTLGSLLCIIHDYIHSIDGVDTVIGDEGHIRIGTGKCFQDRIRDGCFILHIHLKGLIPTELVDIFHHGIPIVVFCGIYDTKDGGNLNVFIGHIEERRSLGNVN